MITAKVFLSFFPFTPCFSSFVLPVADVLHSSGLVKHQLEQYSESVKLYDEALSLVTKEFGGILPFVLFIFFLSCSPFPLRETLQMWDVFMQQRACFGNVE